MGRGAPVRSAAVPEPRAVVRTLRPFGATVRFEVHDRRVLDAVAAAVGRFPTDAGAVGSFRITTTAVPDGSADPAWPVTSVRHDRRTLRFACGSAELRVDHRSATAEIDLPPSLLAIEDAVRTMVEGAVSSLLIGAGALHAVHAGLVELDGTGLLLRGPSGAGKSTLTYACLRSGMAVASDDWVYGVAGQPPDHLVGYPWRVFLVPDAAARFPELASVEPVAHPGSDRWKLPVVPPPARRRRRASVDAVVLLDPSADLELREVGAAEARRRFWGPALPSERRDLPRDWVAQLLDRPTFVLQRGTDPDAAVALLRERFGRRGGTRTARRPGSVPAPVSDSC